MKETTQKLANETLQVIQALRNNCSEDIVRIAQAIIKTYNNKGKVLVFGNGGSAADSQHFVAELVGRFKKERQAFPAIALTTNTSISTALANDYNFDCIFERQIEALGIKDDVAIGISTSGKAKNVIAGLRIARMLGMQTIALTGAKGDNLKELVDVCLQVPSENTPRIQEAHITIIHIICELVENSIA